MMGNRIDKQKIFWWILFCITAGAIWVAQRSVPVMMDDNWYSTLLYEETKISSLGDIVSAQIWHYFNWGGRSIAHGILQLILLSGANVANLLNTVMIFFLAFLLCNLTGKKNLPYLVLTVGLLHAFNANVIMNMYWQSGACNYLYISVILILFLSCYLLKMDEEKVYQRWVYVYILPLGLCAGWSNENMGPTLFLMTLGIMLWRHYKHLKIAPWMVMGNLSCLMGSILVIASPGNFVRVEETNNGLGLWWNFFLRGYYESRTLFDYLFLVAIITCIVIAVNWIFLKQRPDHKEIVLLLGALVSWGAMILSPHYPDRATFGTMILLIGVILSQVFRMLEMKPDKESKVAVACIGVFFWLRGMYFIGEYVAIQWGWII